MRMNIVAHSEGCASSQLALTEVEVPIAAKGEVVVKVAYAGVNRPDVLQRQGLYNPPPGANPYLGLEISGVVAEVGSGVTRWRVGDIVCALTHGGGYAQYCAVDERHCMPVPAGLTLAQSAALPENYLTVWANLFANGVLGPEKRILIHGGSSGIGITAIQLAREIGAEVFTTAGTEEKLEVCRSHGAQHLINYRKQDFEDRVRVITGGDGVDAVLDMVGGRYIQKNLNALALDGNLVQISFMAGSRVDIDLQPVMIKRLCMRGSTLRARTPESKASLVDGLQTRFWPVLEAGRCLPHIHTVLPLEKAAQAHNLMESGAHSGKILLEVA